MCSHSLYRVHLLLETSINHCTMTLVSRSSTTSYNIILRMLECRLHLASHVNKQCYVIMNHDMDMIVQDTLVETVESQYACIEGVVISIGCDSHGARHFSRLELMHKALNIHTSYLIFYQFYFYRHVKNRASYVGDVLARYTHRERG